MLVLGIMIAAGEDRHRTMLATYLAEPRRERVLHGQARHRGRRGSGVRRAHLRLTMRSPCRSTPPRAVHHFPVSIAALWLGTTLLTACFGLLGVALGALTRNTVGAIIGALGWVFLVEIAILQPLVPSLAKWLPTGAAVALTTPNQMVGSHLPPATAAVVLIGWSAVIAVVASTFTLRRELR